MKKKTKKGKLYKLRLRNIEWLNKKNKWKITDKSEDSEEIRSSSSNFKDKESALN